MGICLIVKALRLISCNYKGFNKSKVSFINSLLSQCNVLLIQESWFYISQFDVFENMLIAGNPIAFVEWMNP